MVAAALALTVAVLAAAPQKPSIVVTRVQAGTGVNAGVAELLTGALVSSVNARGVFSRVVSPAQLESVLDLEKQRQLTDCSSESCMAELAGALGVDFVMTCSVGQLGADTHIVNATLVRSRTGDIAASVSRTIQHAGVAAVAQAFDDVVVELLVGAKLLSPRAAESAREQKSLKSAQPAPPATTPAKEEPSAFSFRPWMAVALASCAAVPVAPLCLGASVGAVVVSVAAYGRYASNLDGVFGGTDPVGTAACGISVAGCFASVLFVVLAAVSVVGACSGGVCSLVLWTLDRVFFNVTEKLEDATRKDEKPKRRRRSTSDDDDL